MELRLLAVIALLLCLMTLAVDFSRSPPPARHDALVPSGAQGKLALPEDEFRPVLDRAAGEMKRRFDAGRQYAGWKRAASWLALAVSAAVSLIGAFFGKSAGLGPGADVAEVLGAAERPQKAVRLVCLMLATSSILGLLAQNLEAESASLTGSARSLSEAIIETTSALYDPQTTEVKARVALRKLEAAMSQ